MSLVLRWIRGIFTHRPERLWGAIAGVALTIALLASLGIFFASSFATLTRRAIAGVPVNWQVLLTPGADEAAIKNAIGQTTPYTALEKVGYAEISGFSATTGGTVQTTGPGKVLGIGPRYRVDFPREIRQLTGSKQGILVFQQTAANLRVKEGDQVTIKRVGLPPVNVKVDGVIDLPYADSLFQAIGVPPGTAPTAPPDNVLLIPMNKWHGLFDPQEKIRPDTVSDQLHVRIGQNLPADPVAAYTYVTQRAHNLEARIAGAGIVGDNLAARLSAVRSDALYARVLFLFLGLPGAVLAMLLTISITASGKRHRLQEQALLRIRGASTGQLLKFEAMEALVVGILGVILGSLIAYWSGRFLAPSSLVLSRATLLWLAGSAVAGFALAVAAVTYPAWRQARLSTVSASRALVRTAGKPLWRTLYLDYILLVASALVYWRTTAMGYEVVLAPEGVPQVAIHYSAFIAPFCLWVGGVLVAIRFWEYFLEHQQRVLSKFLQPVAKNLAGVVTSSLSRERALLTRGVVLVALAISFAVSTAIFNTSYNAQAIVDAQLTNGADVTVQGLTQSPPSSKLAELKTLQDAAAVQPMMHRFAYVGHDLQDMYGIDPRHIGEATSMSNAYFAGGNAKAALAALAKKEDGVMVSEETRRDFQLHQGDQLNLRLQCASDNRYHIVPFTFIGVTREFPTAPKDSFLVANAAYIARQTGIKAEEIVLIKAKKNPGELAPKVRKIVSVLPGAKVTDIGSVQKVIGSSLTSVNLRGLTALELVFAVVMVMVAGGLVLALGLSERRRNFAILDALGAKTGQLGSFIWGEGLVILVGGLIIGLLQGFGVAQILVRVLKGVFDPPPYHLIVPWLYLALLVAAAGFSTAVAVVWMKMISHRPSAEELRKF